MPHNTRKHQSHTTPVPGLLAEELAAALRCSPRTLTAWEKSGRIPASIRIGRRRLWPASTVAALLGTAQKGGAQC